jgi:hypothetical protein
MDAKISFYAAGSLILRQGRKRNAVLPLGGPQGLSGRGSIRRSIPTQCPLLSSGLMMPDALPLLTALSPCAIRV